MIRLKELRKEKNKTQRDVAKFTGYMQTLISKWEHGDREPDIATLIKLADYFNVSVDYLIGKDNRTNHTISEDNYSARQLNCIHMLKKLPPKHLDKVEAYLTALSDISE